MAGIGAAPAKGRRKSLDAELNLVPFIDLLSMCICFLLMTAVWMELGAVNVKQLMGTEAASQPQNSYEMDVKYLNPQRVEVNLKQTGRKAQKFTVEGSTNEQRLASFRDVLKGLAARLVPSQPGAKPQLGSAVSMARVTTAAGVSYGEIVTVMDALREFGIVSLGLVPVRE